MIKNEKEVHNSNEKSGYDMLYLTACSLHGIVPEQRCVEQMNLSEIFRISSFHSITAMVYMSLESSDFFSASEDKELVRKWKEAKEKAISKTLLLDEERKKILVFMEERNIWYLLLKGIILKDLYPRLGMRQMADNDILYDKNYQKELFNFMTRRGYEASEVGKGNHDVYKKKPIYNYELHTQLYSFKHNQNWQSYYKNIKKRLIKDKSNNFGYHFSDEDFYLYIITHGFKHYSDGGTGIRTLIDIYLFLQYKEASLDWNYVEVELDELCIAEFESESRKLCKKLFSKKTYSLSQKERKTLFYYLNAGTYGTMKNCIEKKVRKFQPDQKPVTTVTKLKYCYSRFFPDIEHYKNFAPFVYRHKWLIPFYLVFRTIRGLIKNRKKIWIEIQELRRLNFDIISIPKFNKK